MKTEQWSKDSMQTLEKFCDILKWKAKGDWKGKKYHTLSGRLFESEDIPWDKAFEEKAAQVFQECNSNLRKTLIRKGFSEKGGEN